MTRDVVFVMDDLAEINPVKDTTFALMLEAQRRGLSVACCGESDLRLEGGACMAGLRRVTLHDRSRDWFAIEAREDRALGRGDLILMRCDPPVDDTYLYATMMLDRAAAAGARVVNRPEALRNFNEKLAITRFPDLITATTVTSDTGRLRDFVHQHGQAVVKPLDGMGGRGIFMAGSKDPNLNVILETLTDHGTQPAMAQEYLPRISEGDNRVLIVHGRPVPFVLARIPGASDFRGNLARGGRGEGREIHADERRIAERVGPFLLDNGVEFAGIDVIGDRLTEINVTSPTCVRELDARFEINISGMLFDHIADE